MNQNFINLVLIGALLVLLAACAESRRSGFDLGKSFEAKDFFERQSRQGGGSAE